MSWKDIDLTHLHPEGAFYIFDLSALTRRIEWLRKRLPKDVCLCYAVKANPFITGEIGGVERFEICSPGEWAVCEKLGLDSARAVVSGLYKPEDFIRARVSDPAFKGILTVESMQQYGQICRAATDFGRRVPVLVRLTNGSQFGVDEADAEAIIARRAEHPLVDILGIQFFSGTQKTSVKKLVREIEAVDAFLSRMREAHGYEAREFEYGPGLPAVMFHEDDFDMDAIMRGLSEGLEGMASKVKITLELGRGIAAGCGLYCTHVVDVKRNRGQGYLVTDGGMHQMVYYGQFMAMKRPWLFVAGKADAPIAGTWNICGALCSMNDLILKQAELPEIEPGDLICFENTGAYCVTEGISLFLSRDLPAVYLMREDGAPFLVREAIETAALNTPEYERKI